MNDISDHRHVETGWEIPSEAYADQPYVAQTDDGAWLCVMTTGHGREGEPGQHVISTRSTDNGRTWSRSVDIEPADGPEASYATLLKTPYGRVYAFYNHNTDNLRRVKADDPPYPGGWCTRVDSQGHYVFKYSDDHGMTWSAERTEISIREMEIDRQNPYRGDIQFFWNVGRPFTLEGAAYVSVHKVGGFGIGFFTRSEGVLLRSDNLLTERDPANIRWETLPRGDHGLRTPKGGGPIAEEQSYSVLSDGSIFCVYRTIDGHPSCAYSRDGGESWEPAHYPAWPDGRLLKHPRAANFCWRCSDGRFIYWFHNHGGQSYEGRNPAWLCGGIEQDGPTGRIIAWSQPEVALYADDPSIRMSYPDLFESQNTYYVTETQKAIARVHQLDADLVQGLVRQFDEDQSPIVRGILLDWRPKSSQARQAMPQLPPFTERDRKRLDQGTRQTRRGFTMDVWLTPGASACNQLLLDTSASDGSGLCLRSMADGALEISLSDGQTENRWRCDPRLVTAGSTHHVCIIVDGGPHLILFVVDGKLCDGGEKRPFGWGRFSPNLEHANGGDEIRLGPSPVGKIQRVRLYDRALRVSEAIANYRAGLGA